MALLPNLSNNEEGAGTGRERVGVTVALLLLAVSLVCAYPLLRTEVVGVKVALSLAGTDAESRRTAAGGALHFVSLEVLKAMEALKTVEVASPARPLRLFTLAPAFGSVGSKLRYSLYPHRVELVEFGRGAVQGSVLSGDHLLIYIPAAALATQESVMAVERVETSMVRGYGLVRLYGERFGDAAAPGPYAALYRVGVMAEKRPEEFNGQSRGRGR